MWYFESIYDRYISKLPIEDQTKVHKGLLQKSQEVKRHMFTQSDVADMKALLAKGISMRQIAAMYGCCQATVSKSISGKNYGRKRKANDPARKDS